MKKIILIGLLVLMCGCVETKTETVMVYTIEKTNCFNENTTHYTCCEYKCNNANCMNGRDYDNYLECVEENFKLQLEKDICQ